MKVKEIINALQSFDENTEVTFPNPFVEDGYLKVDQLIDEYAINEQTGNAETIVVLTNHFVKELRLKQNG